MSQSIQMFVKGQKQGIIPGNSTFLKNYWVVSSYDMDLTMPFDPASGLPTGQRVYSPITVTLPFSPRVSQLLQVAATNENLPTVFIKFFDSLNNLAATVTLTNANIRHFGQIAAAGLPTTSINFTFQKIEFTAGTTFLDDWQTPV